MYLFLKKKPIRRLLSYTGFWVYFFNPCHAEYLYVLQSSLLFICKGKPNREDPDQTASSEVLRSGSALLV